MICKVFARLHISSIEPFVKIKTKKLNNTNDKIKNNIPFDNS